MSNKTFLSNVGLELTQKIQLHFPRDIDPGILQKWNGVPAEELTSYLFEVFGKAPKCQNKFLKLISGGESLILDATNGSKTLANAKDVFAWIDSDLKNWNTNHKGLAKGKTPVCVHEMTNDGNFAQLFGSLFGSSPDGMDIDEFVKQHRDDLRRCCFEQDQIINFSVKHRKWLRKGGYGTFLLFESNGQFFVAYVDVFSDDKLHVNVHRFEHSCVWDAESQLHLVVPQLD